jgi:hypothetical protein
MTETTVWQVEGQPVRVVLVEREGRGYINIIDSRGRRVSLWPSHAAQVATGVDLALERVDREGRVRRGA